MSPPFHFTGMKGGGLGCFIGYLPLTDSWVIIHDLHVESIASLLAKDHRPLVIDPYGMKPF